MANHIHSGATVGGAVTTVVFANWYRGIELVNRGSTDMWARFDGVDPTIAGDECFFVPAASFITVSNPKPVPNVAEGVTSNTETRILTAANSTYTVSAGV